MTRAVKMLTTPLLLAAAFVLALPLAASASGPALDARPDSVAAGERVTVDWSAPAEHSPTDWVGLYRSGDPDTDFLSWQYTGSPTAGSMTFTAPLPAGQYEFRYFLDDGFTRAATSNTVTVPRRREAGPTGFASVDALGQDGTTGGEGGPR